MRVVLYRFGDANAIPDEVLCPLRAFLEGIRFDVRMGNATSLRRSIVAGLSGLGWAYRVRIHPSSNLTLTGLKHRVGLAVQMGNMGRMYADLMKLQALYVQKRIDGGILVLCTKAAASRLGSNLANYERLVSEFPLYAKFITVPLIVVGVGEERHDVGMAISEA